MSDATERRDSSGGGLIQYGIEDKPDLGDGIDNRFILGIANINSEVKTLLDIDFIVGQDQAGF